MAGRLSYTGKPWESSPLWAEDNRPQLNPHKFGYILNEPEYCGAGEVVDLLILVASAVRHRGNRDAIRATWDETQNHSIIRNIHGVIRFISMCLTYLNTIFNTA